MKAVIGVVIVVLAVVAGWFVLRQPDAPPLSMPPSVVAPSVPGDADPANAGEVRYPIDQVQATAPGNDAPAQAAMPAGPAAVEPPPSLDESDPVVAEWTAESVGNAAVQAVVPDNLVRRLVATVDNLPRERVTPRLWPVATAAGLPAVEPGEGGMVLSPANARRYAPYVAMAESADVDSLIAGYKRLYPVFQQAYRELGYPTGNFNDRLVAVIDHLLAAPEVEGPIRLVQPKVIYQFADPELEALSAGQKMMVRMGPDNARRIKARLRTIRQRLAGAG
ncbi:MAG: DUF3014 domain-containing protein [Rhodocyclaceae bacterium]|nr:DUF3014 domain-containing protein [Rhodocyclaceae bacterium]